MRRAALRLVLLLGLVPGAVANSVEAAPVLMGIVTDAQTGNPLDRVFVVVYDSSEKQIEVVMTNEAGQYQVSTLPDGQYFVRTATTGPYINELHSDVACPLCPFSAGTPVTISPGFTAIVHFALVV